MFTRFPSAEKEWMVSRLASRKNEVICSSRLSGTTEPTAAGILGLSKIEVGYLLFLTFLVPSRRPSNEALGLRDGDLLLSLSLGPSDLGVRTIDQ